MIALDTNVLVRYLVADEPSQARRAQTIIAAARSAGESILLPDVVLCEMEWVLDSVYAVPRAAIERTLRRLFNDPVFVFQCRDTALAAAAAYAARPGDFSDQLVGANAARQRAATTYTFDKALKGQPGFTLA